MGKKRKTTRLLSATWQVFFFLLFFFGFLKKIINKTSVCLKLTAGLLSYLIETSWKKEGKKQTEEENF